ncbi:MAG TPA: IclR family transcriptional regulator [Jiangellaceae bacterium]
MTTVRPSNDGNRPASQTLDRGLLTLELITDSDEPLSVADVAQHLGLHRSITYRMLRTLEDHGLVERDSENRYAPGARLAILARRVAPTLQSAAMPELTDLANDVGMTAFLVVRQADEAVTLAVVEPRHSTAHVVYRPGTRHAVTRGAPGLALLAGAAPVAGERPEVEEARKRGWAFSHAEVLPGMRSVAAPVVDRHHTCHGAVAVVYVETTNRDDLGARVVEAARAVASAL